MLLVELARRFLTTHGSPALELVTFCSVISPQISEDRPYHLFDGIDEAEKETIRQQCMVTFNESDQ